MQCIYASARGVKSGGEFSGGNFPQWEMSKMGTVHVGNYFMCYSSCQISVPSNEKWPRLTDNPDLPSNPCLPSNNYLPSNHYLPNNNYLPSNHYIPSNSYFPSHPNLPNNHYLPSNHYIP